MTFAHGDQHILFHWLVIFHHSYRRDVDEWLTAFGDLNREAGDGPIFLSHIHFVLLRFLHSLPHLACEFAHFSSLVREEVNLLLLIEDVLLHSCILTLLTFDLCLNLL